MRLEKPVRSGTFSGGSFHFSCSRGMIEPRGGGATAQRREPPAPRGSNAPCHSSRRDRESAVKRGSARGRRRSGKNIYVIPMSLRAPCCAQRALRWQTLPSKPSIKCTNHSRSRLSHSSAPSHQDEMMNKPDAEGKSNYYAGRTVKLIMYQRNVAAAVRAPLQMTDPWWQRRFITNDVDGKTGR